MQPSVARIALVAGPSIAKPEDRGFISRTIYPKGTTIYHQGDRADRWFEVCSGVVRTCRFHADGRRHLTGFHYPGDVFGLDQQFHCESAEAVSHTEVSSWPQPFAAFGDLDPRSRSALEKALDAARQSIQIFGYRSAERRVAAFLAGLAKKGPDTSLLELPMARSDIADYLGLSLHTVSRIIADLARRQVVSLENAHRLRILEQSALCEPEG